MKSLIRHHRRTKKLTFNGLFFLGLGMFLTGVLGYLFQFFTFHSAAEIVPNTTTFFLQTESQSVTPETLDATVLPLALKTISHKITHSPYDKNWIGKNGAITIINPQLSALLLEYNSKQAATDFLKKTFLMANESFVTKQIGAQEYQTAQYSSNLSYFFADGWLVLTTNEQIIPLFQNHSLAQTTEWESFIEQKNRSDKKLFFVSLPSLAQHFSQLFTHPLKRALVDGTSRIFSHLGMTQSAHQTQITLFKSTETEPAKNFIPELFTFIPQHPVWVFNGNDVSQEIESLTNTLASVHPQYGTIFQQVFPQVFGSVFVQNPQNFQNFLTKLHGQYAFVSVIDQEEKKLSTALISRFGVDTQVEKIKTLNKILTETQANFTPVVKTVELPNGNTRQELVAENNNVQIQTTDGIHSLSTSATDKQISYGFRDGYLVLSTDHDLVQKILTLPATAALTNQKDFRDFVLYNAKNANAYGILDTKKLKKWWQIKESTKSKTSPFLTALSFLNPTDTPLFFLRLSDSQSIRWKFVSE